MTQSTHLGTFRLNEIRAPAITRPPMMMKYEKLLSAGTDRNNCTTRVFWRKCRSRAANLTSSAPP